MALRKASVASSVPKQGSLPGREHHSKLSRHDTNMLINKGGIPGRKWIKALTLLRLSETAHIKCQISFDNEQSKKRAKRTELGWLR